MKKAIVLALSLLMILSLVACGASPSATTSPTGQQQTSSPTPSSGNQDPTPDSGDEDKTQMSGKLVVWTYDAMMPEFSVPFQDAYPNIELEVMVVPQFSTKLTQALTTGVNLPDVITPESTNYGTLTNHAALETLNQEPYNAEQYRDLFIPFWWDSGYSLNGEMRIMPNAPGMGCTYYRRDLAIKAFGTDNDTELEALFPDMRAVVAQVASFKEKTGADIMPGADFLYSAAVKQLGRSFLDVGTMTVDFNMLREPFELALQAVSAGLPPTSINFGDGMKDGTWFMYQDGSWGEQYTMRAIIGQNEDGTQKQEGEWGVMSTPGGNVNKGGNGFSIIASSPNKEAAWEYIKFMTLTPSVQANMLEKVGSYPALIEAQSTPFFQDEIPFFNGQKARLKYGELANDMIIIPITPYDNAIETICNKYVGPVLEGTMSIDDAIIEMATEVKREIRVNVIPEV